MTFLDRVLDQPHYGFVRNEKFYVPSHREILKEFVSRLNVFKSKKNWLPLFGWTLSLSLVIPLYFFFAHHFSWPLFALGMVYSMVLLGSHGTFWLHRYCTHRGFKFKNKWVALACRNLVIRIIPEEIYVVSHHVHHQLSEKPGDPYNVHGGWLYCFLADANHQTIAKDLSEKDYAQLCKLMGHTTVKLNSYKQYQKWGSLCHPFWSTAHYALNWGFWFGVFWLIGGPSLALAIFGLSAVWAIGVRTYNYDGHGGGRDKRQDGIDFNREDLSVNQLWPGYVAGEWHNNHHLYPNGARSGFLRYQLDLPWIAIKTLHSLGLVVSYRDYKADFVKNYLEPYLAKTSLTKDLPTGTHVEAPL